MKKFDLVSGPNMLLAVIVSDPFAVNLFQNGVASQLADKTFDIADPMSYDEVIDDFVTVYVFCGVEKGLQVVRLVNLKLANMEFGDGYIPFDWATSQLREIKSLLRFARKLWNESDKEMPNLIE